MTLDLALEQAAREQALKAKAAQALADGRITQAEYEYFLRKELGLQASQPEPVAHSYAKRKSHANHRRTTLMRVAAVLAIVGFMFLGLGLLMNGPGLTGLVTFEPTQQVQGQAGAVFNESGTLLVNATNITGLRVSGSLSGGAADIYLDIAGQRYLVYHGDASAPAYAVTTEKESYALGESVSVTVLPASASSTLWLTDGTGAKTPVTDGFVTTAAGAFTLDALINDSGTIMKATTTFIVRDDANPANDVLRQSTTPTVTFTEACVESCLIPATGNAQLSLDVRPVAGATLTLTAITVEEAQANQPPVQAGQIPDVAVAQGETTTLDLSRYFTDPENGTLTYDYMNAPGASMTVNGNLLTITGVSPGSSQSIIYASDGSSLVQSNLFTITVTPGAVSSTNATSNVTENATAPNRTNATPVITPPANGTTLSESVTNATAAQSNLTSNLSLSGANVTALDCSNPDLNLRPLECLQQNASRYFNDTDKYWENLDRMQVAKFNAVGNMLIAGEIVERSGGAPAPGDFTLGYNDGDGNFVATIWIDGQGNLHLKGTLHEEQFQLNPQPGSYSLITRRSIYIMYADTATGDLYLRGNLVPYRRSFT